MEQITGASVVVKSIQHLPMPLCTSRRRRSSNSDDSASPGRARPAHLGIPIDIQSWTDDTASPKNPPGHTSLASQAQVPLPPLDQLRRAADILGSCRRVAIMAGAGARDARRPLEEVADTLAAPIVKAGLGKDAVPEDSPLTTGGMGLIGTRASQEVLENCDGFLFVGSSTPYYEFWPEPGKACGVQIDIDPAAIGMRYPVEVGLAGDAHATLAELLPLLQRNPDRAFSNRPSAPRANGGRPSPNRPRPLPTVR